MRSVRDRVGVRAAAVGAMTLLLGLPVPPSIGATVAAPVCRTIAVPLVPDPYAIPLVPTADARGASGEARLTLAQSPFGVTLTEDGRYRYDIRLVARGLPSAAGGAYVAWAATPSLDQVLRLGALDARGEVSSRVSFNKFLVFVTAEPSAEVERWSGPILLRGISRSGRMHTMAGHGPFEGEPCE